MSHSSFPTYSRRRVLRLIAAALASLGTVRLGLLSAKEEGLPHLTDVNPSAASLGYTEDAGTVDSQKFPNHKSGQHCANCKFFQGDPSAQYGPCQLYPGNAVNANGWCGGYAPQ